MTLVNRIEESNSARAWNPVATGPGHRAVALNPDPLSSCARASVKERT
jgi:hypothetical protein